ncbi:MAG: Gldg family protein [Candidatus Binatia bacterium]
MEIAMVPRAPILGITGLIFVLFGLLSHWLAYDPAGGLFAFGWYSMLHLGLGFACLAWYFATGSSSLTHFVRMRSTKYGAGALLYSALFLTVVVMLNFLGARYHKRFDFSAEGVNSLSQQSREVLDRLDEDVLIEAFIEGGREPVLEELFGAYRYHSDRIQHRFIDPQIRPELAQAAGIAQVPTLRITKGDRSTLVNATEEESVTNGIHRVSTAATKRIYFTQGHGEPDISDAESPGGYGQFAGALRNQNYEVIPVFLAEARNVPEDANVLILASPTRELFPNEIEMIDRYLTGGGSVMFLLEPRRGAEIVALLAKWGIAVGDDVIVDQQMRLFQGVTLGLEPVVSSYGKHPVVEPISERTVFSLARSVSPAEPGREGITVDSIAFTPASSWAESEVDRLFDQSEARLTEEDVEGPISIAVAAAGSVADLGDEGKAEVKIVAFGDSTFATNKFWLQLFNDALALSATGWLAGQEELISIGPRAVRASRTRLSPAQARSVFYLSVLVLPELILMCGILVWWRRSSV